MKVVKRPCTRIQRKLKVSKYIFHVVMGAADYVNKHENLDRNEDTLIFEEYMTSMLSETYYQMDRLMLASN